MASGPNGWHDRTEEDLVELNRASGTGGTVYPLFTTLSPTVRGMNPAVTKPRTSASILPDGLSGPRVCKDYPPEWVSVVSIQGITGLELENTRSEP